MIAVNYNLFSTLSENDKIAVNDYIEFLHHKENEVETDMAVNDALSGRTVGQFNSIDALMVDLYADD